ncbi:MAG: ABC transporter substrate-binding protein [Thermodesulfobacteriota bacterium]
MKNLAVKGLSIIFMILVLSSSAWAADRPIRILMIDPMSGPMADSGEKFLAGIRMAAEEANAQGGLLGRKVEAISEDSQVKADVAVRKAQKYLLDGSVDFVCTGIGSHVAKALTDATKQHNVVFINYTFSDDATGKDFAYHSVRLTYNSSMLARALVAYIAQKTPFKKFYLLNQDYTFGHDMATAFKREVLRQIQGVQIVGEDYHPLSTKDMSPFLTKIKGSNADAILTGNWGADLSILLKQRQELEVKPVVVNNMLAMPVIVREFPEAAIGCIAADIYMMTTNTPENHDFVSRWQQKHKGTQWPDPDGAGGRTYIGTKFLLEAIQKAKSVELNKLIPAMEGMRQKTLNGEAYLRACDHQLLIPMPVASVRSTKYPYLGVPTLIPAAAVEIEETAVENPRCRRKQ